MLKSDIELLKECECSLDLLRSKAREIISNIEAEIAKIKQKSSKTVPKKSSLLFDLYDETNEDNVLTRSAICYLLKNGSKLPKPDKIEDRKKFTQRRRKVQIKIKRLKEQIEGSRPQVRDLTNEQWLNSLQFVTTPDIVNLQYIYKTFCILKKPQSWKLVTIVILLAQKYIAIEKSWQAIVLSEPKTIPFPITYETNEDLKWHKNEAGRLCVRFNGLSEHTFQIYCDRRQLHWFKRFFEDQQIKKEGKDIHSSGLFTLRSAKLTWRTDKKKNTGQPWNDNRIVLFCTVDTKFWSAEGTQIAREEKEAKILKTIDRMKEKGELTVTQQSFVKRKHATLSKLHNSYPRPSRQLYRGRDNMILGVAMGLSKPATIAIVDRDTAKAITYRSIKQLLGNNYRLLNRQRQQKRALSHLRHKAQKRSADNQKGESNLGEYVDRLIAKAIVELAKQYQVSAIAVPKLEHMREIVQSEIKAKAEAKIPGYEEGQKKYAKQYRINIHNWSYGRLIENIITQASKLGIAIKEVKQSVRGSPTEKAKDMAMKINLSDS